MESRETPGGGLSLAALVDLIVERSETPAASRTQLAKLIAASRAINSELDLQSALHNVIQVACDLVSADFGALGVISADGQLESFIHVGMTPEQVEHLGAPPTGHGILGAVITDKAPIRLANLADDPRSAGFPADHPPMKDFLGVPVRIGDTIYGNLYLTGSDAGEFDDTDQQVIITLAGMAGTVIANSRLYEEARNRNRWLVAAEEINHRILTVEDPSNNLALIASTILDLADASFVAFVPLDNGRATATEQRDLSHLSPAASISHDNLSVNTRRFGPFASDADYLPDAALPTTLHLPWEESSGFGPAHLLIARNGAAHPFSAPEREMVERFARSVALARELAHARIDRERMALIDERDRIARDLHDHVIQNLFAVGLGLQSLIGKTSGVIAARLTSAVESIDVTISQIRQTIFQLGSPPNADEFSQKASLNKLVRTTLEGKGIDSSLDFRGPIDTLVDTELGDEASAVLREALTNVVRHSEASRVDISVAITPAILRIVVSDNGRGIGDTSRRSGISNLEQRAIRRGGSFAITNRKPTGTTLEWTVPVIGTP
jgi:signal transduction histidine kinase